MPVYSIVQKNLVNQPRLYQKSVEEVRTELGSFATFSEYCNYKVMLP